MPKYTVIGLVDATVSAEVEADTPQQAAETAEISASICHQCANDLDVGDVIEIRVNDKNGNEVYSDTRDARRDALALARHLKDRKRLPADVAEIVRYYAGQS